MKKLPPMNPQIGARLRAWRERLGITAASVARRVGCSVTAIQLVEGGKVRLTSTTRLGYYSAIKDCKTLAAPLLEIEPGPVPESIADFDRKAGLKTT